MEENYKIIKIVDDTTLIINAGINDGIHKGDEFEIYEIGQEVFDPDSKESLGTLDTIKETVEVINVLPKMSICRHRLTYNIATQLTFSRTTNKTLNVEATEISGGLSNDTKIKIGDKARKI